MTMIKDDWLKNLIMEYDLFRCYRNYLHDLDSGWELYWMDDDITDDAFPRFISYGDLFKWIKESEKINFNHEYLLIGDDLDDSYSFDELYPDVLDHMSTELAEMICLEVYPNSREKGRDLFKRAEELCSKMDLVTTGNYEKDKGTDILIVASVLKKLDEEKAPNKEERK